MLVTEWEGDAYVGAYLLEGCLGDAASCILYSVSCIPYPVSCILVLDR